MLDNSCQDYTSDYFNRTIPIISSVTQEQKSNSIAKIEQLLENLKKAQALNLSMQNNLINIITESQNKMTKIESMLQKINSIKKPKPKKHMRSPNYIPLESFYYYIPKRTHLYFHLLERVFESSKKDSEKDEDALDNSEGKIKMNRFKFTKDHDNMLNKVIFLNEKNNVINWYLVSAEMNKIYNNSKNNKINNNNKNIILNGLEEEENNNSIIKNNNNVINNIIDSNDINKLKDEEDEEIISQKKEKKKNNKKNKESANNTKESITIFTPLICYVRHLETSSFYKYKKWNNEEDKILRKAILYYGPKNWQQISYCLDGRNNSQCFHRWMKGINPKIKRDKWSFEEDLTLGISLSKIYQKKKWSKIANHLLGRTDIQCRERWCNILDPSLEDVEWTNEEDLKLLNLYRKYKNKWSLIAKHYGNRTDNTCWRRWKYLTCINFSKSNVEGLSNSNINDINGMSKFILDKGLGISQDINSSHVSEFNDLGKKMPFKVVNAGKK